MQVVWQTGNSGVFSLHASWSVEKSLILNNKKVESAEETKSPLSARLHHKAVTFTIYRLHGIIFVEIRDRGCYENGIKRTGLQPPPKAFLLAPCCDRPHSTSKKKKKVVLLDCERLQKYTHRCERRCILAHADTKQESSNALSITPAAALLFCFAAHVTDVAFGWDRRWFVCKNAGGNQNKLQNLQGKRGSANWLVSVWVLNPNPPAVKSKMDVCAVRLVGWRTDDALCFADASCLFASNASRGVSLANICLCPLAIRCSNQENVRNVLAKQKIALLV